MAALYSPLANTEIQKIQQHLEQHPEIQPAPRALSHGISPNPLIARMLTLFAECQKSYEELHQQIPNEAWKEERVIEAASGLMALSFVISVLALEECREINQTLFEEHARNHNHCQTVYSRLRRGFCQTARGFGAPSQLSSEFEESFYTEGKIQNVWNRLNREYVARRRAHPAFSDKLSELKDDTREKPLFVSRKAKTQIFTNYLTKQQYVSDAYGIRGSIQRPVSPPPPPSASSELPTDEPNIFDADQ